MTLSQTTILMKAILPIKPFDELYVIEIIRYYEKRNYDAYMSHRKRKLNDMNLLL